jgi:hypothetical protein
MSFFYETKIKSEHSAGGGKHAMQVAHCRYCSGKSKELNLSEKVYGKPNLITLLA